MKKLTTILFILPLLSIIAGCSKDNFDTTLKTDDFLFFKLTHGSVTRELHSTIGANGRIDGLIYSLNLDHDSAFLTIQSQIMATAGNPNYSFIIFSAKKGTDMKGNYTDDVNSAYNVLMGMDEMKIKPGSVTINISSIGSSSKYGNYIEGSINLTLVKINDASFSELASGSFRLKEN